MNPKQIASAIQANVEAVDSGTKTWEQFGLDNRALWNMVAKGEQNIIGSACARRVARVHAAFANAAIAA